jgi:hypothetical protein
MDLLFDMATYHALLKLRLHHELSLQMLDAMVHRLGSSLRRFKKYVCDIPDIQFSPEEIAKRERRKAREDEKRAKKGLPPISRREPKAPNPLSLNTSKIHKIHHSVNSIRRFGTTDNYTTQNVGCS